MDPAPLIVSVLFGGEDFAWLDRLRRTHFPSGRNQIDAHLTLFHHLPPSCEAELRGRLSEAARAAAPPATAAGLLNLGRGVAIRINSPELAKIRADLAAAFHCLLTPQDAAGWRAHVTIQNKVSAGEARGLLDILGAEFRPSPIVIAGLAVWRYRGGPWEAVSRHMFRR